MLEHQIGYVCWDLMDMSMGVQADRQTDRKTAVSTAEGQQGHDRKGNSKAQSTFRLSLIHTSLP